MFQINYRQADTVVVVVVVVVVDAAAATGQPLSDHTNGLPHQAVDWHVAVGGPRLADPLRDAPSVG